MTKTAPTLGFVRPIYFLNDRSFRVQMHMHFMFGAGKPLRLSFNNLNNTPSHCTNISLVQFFQVIDQNGTK